MLLEVGCPAGSLDVYCLSAVVDARPAAKKY